MNHCPTCRGEMSNHLNWFAGRIAQWLKYPCRNAEHGCLVTTLLTGKKAHESTCPFRVYNCLFHICSWTGFQQDMLPHLRSTHPWRFRKGPSQQIDVDFHSATLFNTDWAIFCFRILRIFCFNINFQIFSNTTFSPLRRDATESNDELD